MKLISQITIHIFIVIIHLDIKVFFEFLAIIYQFILLNGYKKIIKIKYKQKLDSYIYANDNYNFYFKATLQ